MVRNTMPRAGGIIFMSIIFSILLMIIPLPDSWRLFRPEFVVLTLIYWSMALPHRVNIGFAWVVGLMMDVILGGNLGLFAFCYAFVIYLVLVFHLQLRQYPRLQQAGIVFSLVLLLQLILIVSSVHKADWSFWWPAMISMVLWPLIYSILRRLRRTFHVN